jgi:hypothetical protein
MLVTESGKEIFPSDETYDEAEKHRESLLRVRPELGSITIIPIELSNIQPSQVMLTRAG